MSKTSADPNWLRHVGGRLSEARTKAGLSHAEVAQRLDMPRPQTVGDWEVGKGNFSIGALFALCDLYKVSCDWVLGLSQMPKFKGRGGIINLEVERAVMSGQSLRDVDLDLRRLRALPEDGIIFGYPVPSDFEVVDDGEWSARLKALNIKLDRLGESSKVRPWFRARKSDEGSK